MAGTPRVLVVEDDDINYRLLQTVLKKMPIELVHANNGAEAIQCIEAEAFPLILLDITLPDMHGWKVLDHFRADAQFANTRVIVITGHSEPVHRVISSMQSSVVAYLQKPYKVDELQRQIREHLNLNA